MKIRSLAGCAALLAAVVLGGCAISLGESELLAESRSVAIAGEDLQRHIPEPVAGAAPTRYFDTPRYTGIVVWTPKGGVFEPYTEYTAVVTLQPASGYNFTKTPAAPEEGSFSYTGREVFHGSGAGGTLTISIDFGATGSVVEMDYDLQRYVPIPVAGADPVKELIRSDLKLTALWMDGSGAPLDEEHFVEGFVFGETYQAELTLRAQDPYRFNMDRPFAYPEGEVATQPNHNVRNEEERILFVSYYPTRAATRVSPVNSDLTLHIPAPVAEETAALDFETAEYRGTVVWKLLYSETDTLGTNMPGNLFRPEALYRADVALYAAPGVTLEGAVFSHSGGTLQAAGASDGSSHTELKITFPRTGKLVISDLDLTLKVPRPVTGGTPVVYISGPQYTGTVAWKLAANDAPHSGLFGPGTVYKAVVSLTAASDYAFAGIEDTSSGSFVFAHTGGTVGHEAGAADTRIEVTVAFPATAPNATVSDLDLTLKVPQPVNGGVPVTTVSGPQYATETTVQWEQYAGEAWAAMEDGTFRTGTAYRVVFALTAAPGYTFAGILPKSPSSGFTYTGAGVTVAHGAGAADTPIEVTVAFPATAPDATVSDLDLILKVPQPVNGGIPVTTISGHQYATRTPVSWEQYAGEAWAAMGGGAFQTGTIYRVRFTLTAAPGYTFAGIPAKSSSSGFTYTGTGVTVTHGAGAADTPIEVTVTFPETARDAAVSDLDLTLKVPQPVNGGVPVTTVSGHQYATETAVQWERSAGTWTAMGGGAFQTGTIYRVRFTLAAASGYTFAGIPAKSSSSGFTYTGTGVTVDHGAGTGKSLAVTITFPITARDAAVSDLDLTLKVPRPVNGGSPVATVFGPQYSAGTTVRWERYAGTAWAAMWDGDFQTGTAYRVRFTLTAASGYTFAGIAAPPTSPCFTYTGTGVTVTHTAGTGTGNPLAVTITFPETSPDVRVSDLDLTLKVPQPVTGVASVKTVYSEQYSGTVTWEPSVGTFGANTKYIATLNLSAKPGYTFTGLGADTGYPPCFTHSADPEYQDPRILTNTGDKVQVGIRFQTTSGLISSFGPVTNTDSALFYMNSKKSASTPVHITLPSGTELLAALTLTRAGTSSSRNVPQKLVIDGGGRVLEAWSQTVVPLISLIGDGSDNGLEVTLKNITLKGKGGYNAPLVKISGKAKLILGSGAILEGNVNNTTIADNYGGAVHIAADSFLEMEAGSIIRNNTSPTFNTTNRGGGVYVAGGTFTMNGGSIYGNVLDDSTGATFGGGVYVASGTFSMNGGSISGNTASGNGGGVYVASGTFTMNGASISGNTTKANGGGVYVATAGTFTMTGGSITNNQAASTTSENGKGGGVYAAGGTFTMSGGGISGNTASGSSANNASGGGVYLAAGTFTMSSGSIANNTANGGIPGLGKGGGVYVKAGTLNLSGKVSGNTATVSGGGVYVEAGDFTMSGELSDNTVQNGNGGGVYKAGSGAFTMRSGAKIYDNTAASVSGAASGGGVYVEAGAFTMYGKLSGNTAKTAGGGVYMAGSGTFTVQSGGELSGNTVANGNGGGVYVAAGAFTIKGELSGNEAQTSGGGVYVESGTFTVQSGGRITGNTLSAGSPTGGGVYMAAGVFEMRGELSGHTAHYGGGVYVAGGTLNLYGQISSNTAAASGGGVYLNSGTLTMYGGARISGNTAIAYGGGGVYVAAGNFTMYGELSGNTVINGDGGGVYKAGSGTFTVQSGGKISRNTVTNGNGGGVYVAAGAFTMYGEISGNAAQTSGGGVYKRGTGTFTVQSGGKISGNTLSAPSPKGGGVYVAEGAFTMYGELSGHTARYGGGVYVAEGTVNLYGKISSNTATDSGGGVYKAGSGDLAVYGEISGNTAKTSGGGVYKSVSGTFTMQSGAKISNNTATGGSSGLGMGGGIYVAGGTFTISKGSEISGNEAKGTGGGGVYVADGTLNLYGKITGNATTGDSLGLGMGGGIYMAGKLTMHDGSEISGNTAGSAGGGNGYGGGVYKSGAVEFVMNSGAKIVNNKAKYGGGVYKIETGLFRISGEISYNTASADGGGIYVIMGGEELQLYLSMVAGAISYNTANTSGGGAFIKENGGFTMQDGSGISNNTAIYGGGVYKTGVGRLTMQAGSQISNNTASDTGGGIWISADDSVAGKVYLDMESGSEVSGNTVTGGLNSGGGIYITCEASNAGTFQNAGSIRYNKVSDAPVLYLYGTGTGNGGGVRINGTGANFINSGSISGNTANGGLMSAGGVFMMDGTFTNSGSIIDNTVTAMNAGGGVTIMQGTFTNTSAGLITHNMATGAHIVVGGVFGSGFTNKGTIENNYCNGALEPTQPLN